MLRTEVLAGLVVALALIPEAISFSIIAGVDPRIGLFASFTMAVSIAFLGGRPAMISAATGAIALVIAPVVRDHGYDYLVATVLLGGAIQVALGLLGVARLMRFVPRQVMVGFVNALAILIFLAQVPHLVDVPWAVYPMVAVGIAPGRTTAAIEITRLVRRELRIVGSYGARTRSDMPDIIRLAAAGIFRPETMVTQRFSLDQADAAYKALARGDIVGRAIVVM